MFDLNLVFLICCSLRILFIDVDIYIQLDLILLDLAIILDLVLQSMIGLNPVTSSLSIVIILLQQVICSPIKLVFIDLTIILNRVWK